MTAQAAVRKGIRSLLLDSPYSGRKGIVVSPLRIVGCHVEVETPDGVRFLVDRQTKVRKA